MSSHLKRQQMPKNWGLHRKGTTFVARGTRVNLGIPLIIVLRDLLKIVKTRKETKIALNKNLIKLNSNFAKNETESMTLFDTLSIVPSNEHYRLILNERGKFELEKISEKDSIRKISKIMNKRMLKGKKTQYNLKDGRNYISNSKYNVNDSAVVNLSEKKIEKIIELKENSKVIVFEGKHAGKSGKVKNLDAKHKIIQVELNKKENGETEEINVLLPYVMAVE